MTENPQPLSRRRIFAMAVLFECGLLGIAFVLALWFQVRIELSATVRGSLLGLLGTLPPLAGLWLSRILPVRALRDLKRVVDEQVIPLFDGFTVLQLGVVAALAGLSEELLFRGAIQPAAAASIGPTSALLATSLLFAAVHAISTAYAAVAFAISIYLGWVMQASSDLWIPVTIHALYDFVALVWLVRRRQHVLAQ